MKSLAKVAKPILLEMLKNRTHVTNLFTSFNSSRRFNPRQSADARSWQVSTPVNCRCEVVEVVESVALFGFKKLVNTYNS